MSTCYLVMSEVEGGDGVVICRGHRQGAHDHLSILFDISWCRRPVQVTHDLINKVTCTVIQVSV